VRARIPRARGPVAIIVVLALLVAAAILSSRAPDVPEAGVVSKVVDGDTLHVAAHGKTYKVRLIGVDTPEAHPSVKLDRDALRTKQDKGLITALGRRAAEFTRGLCEGKPCRLEVDPVNVTSRHRDRYGRILAYVWGADAEGNEVLVNAEILREGFGMALTRFPFDEARKAEFLSLQREARAEGRGLWAEWKP
jgi:micrococcal nuclease